MSFTLGAPGLPLDTFLDAIGEMVAALDTDERVVSCSEAVRPLLGYAPEELVGLTLGELPILGPEGLALIREATPRILQGERIGALQIPFVRRDGTPCVLEGRGIAVTGADGRPLIQAILRDATERRRAEERLQAIFDATNDIIVIMGLDGVVQFENSAVERVLGFVPGERVGHNLLDYAHPADVANAVECLKGIMAAGAETALTCRFRHKDGSWRYLETWGSNMAHVPAIGGVLGVARDVTERMRLQERLEAAERLDSIGRLAGGIAHDFNNILLVIMGAAEHLGDRGDLAGDRDVHAILDAADRARQLTGKLLTFARAKGSEASVVDANWVLRGAEAFLRRLLGEACTLRIRGAEAPAFVPMAAGQFEQVLLNLAANARDAMPDGGTVTIASTLLDARAAAGTRAMLPAGDGAVCIRFTDTGVGMAPAVAARVFEPFYTTKDVDKGTGLGLSQVYGMVRAANGDIRVVSDVGQGTTFEIYLPLAGPVVPVRQDAGLPAAQATGETVLVVEDNDDVRRLTVRTLQRAGYQVVEASSGRQALGLLSANVLRVDLLVSDVVMPQMHGATVAQEARRLVPGLPVLFVTGYTPDHLLSRQALDDRTAVLGKPYVREDLLREVRRLLDTVAV